MHEQEALETSIDPMEMVEAAEAAEPVEPTEPAEAVETAEATEPAEAAEPAPAERYLSQAEELRAVYPGFDLTAELSHPILGALLRGEAQPTLRQLYEAVHWEELAAERIRAETESAVAAELAGLDSLVEAAVAEAVPLAVREREEQLLDHIRARGQRPAEGGVRAASGIRMHPAVGRLTRRERAILAKRAENGETIQF